MDSTDLVLYISQNFIMARFPAFERNKVHQILKIVSISPKRLTYTLVRYSLSVCLIFSLILSFVGCSIFEKERSSSNNNNNNNNNNKVFI